jgi:RNA polymerase sigma-70 factor (ECF subfamily)
MMGLRGADTPPASDDASPGVASLVALALTGDRDAFGTLYVRFAPIVHGVLLSHASPEDAADLVHDVFLTALNRLDSLRDPNAFAGWLVTIARNAARMERRRNIRLVQLEGDVAGTDHEHAGLDGETILAAIRSLPNAYREPLMLRLVEGLSGNEIAERTGLAPGSVRVNLHRGMALLRKSLGGTE